MSVDGGHLQVHVIPEVQGAAHLPDVKNPKTRTMAKGKGQGVLC